LIKWLQYSETMGVGRNCMVERNRVVLVENADWRVVGEGWPKAAAVAGAIDAHWQTRVAQSPQMFNGRVHLLVSHEVVGRASVARFFITDFKSFLAWREGVFTDDAVLDGFASALLRTPDGGIVVGRQAAGHLNAGLTYPPAGFIDAADVQPDGSVDIVGSVRREIAEELGLEEAAYTLTPGYYITICAPIVCVAKPLQATISGDVVLARARAHIAQEAKPELDDVGVITSLADVASLAMPPHARLLVESLLAGSVEAV
jgi:hypothetical protein